jgi:hypothetical protein
MTYDERRRKYVVRWRENGRRRIRRFATREEAEVFDRSLSAPAFATDEPPGKASRARRRSSGSGPRARSRVARSDGDDDGD